MPSPDHALPGTRRSMRGLFHRILPRSSSNRADSVNTDVPQPALGRGIDAATRSFWRPGGSAPATLIEATLDAKQPSRDRVADLVRAHEQGKDRQGRRPRGNPAFSEALFVELMRARQYGRAFDLLSDECKRHWGSAEAFASAQGLSLRRLRGVRVKDVRFLSHWTDARAGMQYEEVAELDVEYTFAAREADAVVRRVVHLVPDGGKWRSLCYPA